MTVSITCASCLFNGGQASFHKDKKALLCLKDPPQPFTVEDEDGKKQIRHLMPVVFAQNKCSAWRCVKTYKCIDDFVKE